MRFLSSQETGLPTQPNARLAAVAFAVLVTSLLAWQLSHYPPVTWALVVASFGLFAAATVCALELMSPRSLAACAAAGVAAGWLAEQLGTTFGWLFGRYTYTEVLGPRLLDVPIVIPLMWFALVVVGWVMARLLLWRAPQPQSQGWGGALITAWLAAMLVTAFDLGADPFFVYKLKAWIMEKPDGGWFGETLQGFVGWMTTAFFIALFFERVARQRPDRTAPARAHRAVAVLLAIYSCALVFQLVWGDTGALRVIALFAMGTPLLLAWVGWFQWRNDTRTEVGP